MKNWLGYAKHREAMEAAGNDHDAARAAEEAFSQAHGAQFSAKTVAEAWKTPERMRFDSMGRLLLGKLGNAIGAVHKFNAETERAAPGESAREAFARRQIHAGRLADVKACLRDWISFEQAQSQMKSALQEKTPTRHAPSCAAPRKRWPPSATPTHRTCSAATAASRSRPPNWPSG